MTKKLYLLDAYALIYRGYFPFSRNPRISSKGMDTSATFGFMLTFDEIRRVAQDEYLAVVFDPSGPTFRHEEYPDYKAQRQETPPSIREGVPYIKQIIKHSGVQMYEIPGYEADDVIGTIAKKMESHKGIEVLMVTPDKDYGQLVSEDTYIYKPLKGAEFERLGPTEVADKYGLQSHRQVIDLLALMGDASDNVPGCPGVGQKTAAKLLSQYRDLDEIYAHIDEIKGKVGTNLSTYEEQVRLSRHLVTIETNVPMEFELEDCKVGPRDMNALTEILEELEFRSFLNKYRKEYAQNGTSDSFGGEQLGLFDLPGSQSQAPAPGFESEEKRGDYHKVSSPEEIEDLVQKLGGVEAFAFDTETDGLDPLTAGIVGASFSSHSGEGYYIPLPEDQSEATQMLQPLRPLFLNPGILKVGQNLKFDIEVLNRYGIEVEGPLFDTMIAHYLLNPELPHGMDAMAKNHLGYDTIPISALIGKRGRGQKSMREIPVDEVVTYAAEDADITFRLYEYLAPKMEEEHLHRLFYEMEMPLMQVLCRMEQTGVHVDARSLAEAADDLSSRLGILESEIYESAGLHFNINSPKEVGEVLFDHLKLSDKAKKTKTGNYVTREEELEKVRDKHPVVEMILRYRGLRKLLSTYADALPSLINPTTGRVHTTYNQAATSTGRLSSTNPNLQNIPVRDEDGREIRKAFIPLNPDKELFISADYSQIELRLMAHLSEDPSLLEAFRENRDIHSATASKIFDVNPEEVTREQRRRAKTANFGIIYGISAFGLSERLGIPRSEASDLIKGYFESYPGVKRYMDDAIESARKKGYVETLFGRRRYLKDIHAGNATVRGYAERNAVNAPIQGSAADLIKIAMIRIQDRIKEEGLHSRMILQVHDELCFSVPQDEVERMKSLIQEAMEGVYPDLKVPLTVEIGIGSNWLEAH